MAGRAGKGAKADVQEPGIDAVESKRVLELAFDQGVLSRSRRIAATTLPPTKLMAKADGKDIVKRSSARRNRHLLVFNCQVAPAAAGRLGTLAQLDTKNPVMYINFPQGRLKLLGTLVFPRNKYMVLRLGTKEVVCEDVLESMIVFGESRWVGQEEDNPEEAELPMPADLATAAVHAKYSFDERGAAAQAGGGGGKDAGGEEEEEEEDEDVDEAAEQQAAGKKAAAARRGTRGQRGGKRQRYVEDSDASFGEGSEEEDGDSDVGPAERKLPRLSGSQPSAGGAARRRSAGASQPESHPVIDLVSSGSDEDEPLAERSGKQAKLGGSFMGPGGADKPTASTKPNPNAKPAPKTSSAAKKAAPKRKAAKSQEEDEDEEEEVIDLAGSSEDEDDDSSDGGGGGGPASQRPRRAAGAAAAKKLRVESDSEGSGSEEGQQEGDTGDEASGSEDDGGEASANDEESSDEESEGYAPSE